jgi:hypothetical protein
METEEVKKYLFVDEVEFRKTVDRDLSFYFMGIEVGSDKLEQIENILETILEPFSQKVFHARDVYRPNQNQDIFTKLNKIIFDNELKVYCFPFIKNWLDKNEFSTIKTFDYGSWADFPKNNYRAQSLFFFIHTLNYHLMVKDNQKTLTRIIFDADWQDQKKCLVNEREVLKTLGNIYFTKQSKAICLALADHIAYLFHSIKDNLVKVDSKLTFKTNGNKRENVSKQALSIYIEFEKNLLFKFLDVFEWIKYENKKVV